MSTTTNPFSAASTTERVRNNVLSTTPSLHQMPASIIGCVPPSSIQEHVQNHSHVGCSVRMQRPERCSINAATHVIQTHPLRQRETILRPDAVIMAPSVGFGIAPLALGYGQLIGNGGANVLQTTAALRFPALGLRQSTPHPTKEGTNGGEWTARSRRPGIGASGQMEVVRRAAVVV